MGNNTYVKSIYSIYQDRFKRFKRVYKINDLKNKEFYINLVREFYIYVKEHLMENDIDMFLKYFTEGEKEEFRTEIELLKKDKNSFLE